MCTGLLTTQGSRLAFAKSSMLWISWTGVAAVVSAAARLAMSAAHARGTTRAQEWACGAGGAARGVRRVLGLRSRGIRSACAVRSRGVRRAWQHGTMNVGERSNGRP